MLVGIASLGRVVDELAVGQVLAADLVEVGGHHLGHEIGEGDGVAPAKLCMSLGRVAQEIVDLERAEVARVDLDQELAGAAVEPFSSGPSPFQTSSRPVSAKARSMNSRTLWASPVAST